MTKVEREATWQKGCANDRQASQSPSFLRVGVGAPHILVMFLRSKLSNAVCTRLCATCSVLRRTSRPALVRHERLSPATIYRYHAKRHASTDIFR